MRITVPSYIIPGTYLENVRFIDNNKTISGIELLFFIFDDETERLFLTEKEDISEYTERFGFSIHMPNSVDDGHVRIVELTEDMVDSYIVHEPEADDRGFDKRLERWRHGFGDRFLLENLIGRDFDSAASSNPDMPICFDTGHVLARGESPVAFADRYGHRIREIHLHGLKNGKDHAPFTGDETWFQELVPFLREFEGTINIELFAIDDVLQVLRALDKNNITEKT